MPFMQAERDSVSLLRHSRLPEEGGSVVHRYA